MKKIIFFDFDGTFFSHTLGKVVDSTLEAFKLMEKDSDVLTCLLTGRSRAELNYFDFRGIKFDYYGLLNGQLVYDSNFSVISDTPISGELYDNIIREFNKKEYTVCLSEENDYYANMINEQMKAALDHIHNPMPEVKEYSKKPIYMASIAFKDSIEKEELLSHFGKCKASCWDQGALDIVPYEIDKGHCVQQLCTLLKIDKANTYAFGDGENDIEMLQAVNVGIAVGNSIDELKKVSDYVTDDVDSNGIYNALKRYNII